MGWSHRHKKKPQVVGWERFNLVRSAKEKNVKSHPKRWDHWVGKNPNI